MNYLCKMSNSKLIGVILALLLSYYVGNRNYFYSKKEGQTLSTKFGRIRGIISVSRDGREFYEFLGIPYAKPPQGSLRFASPQPIEKKWDDIFDASNYGNICAQLDVVSRTIVGKEDCLSLNIHVPKLDSSSNKLLPVMFYIHGGYFMSGSSEIYNPKYFMDEDVLLVTFNYRLSVLGFLNTGDFTVRGNMGLKDQSMALKWVNKNIADFGGDPKQITIFGESAGSASVHYHMLSPMSRGLMQRAISSSGTALNMWTLYEDPSGQAKSFARKLNCLLETSTKMVECLRNVSMYDLLQNLQESLEPSKTKDMVFVPTVEEILDEETFLPDHPRNLIEFGKIARIPWLVGYNADEGLLFASNVMKKADYRKRLEVDSNYLADVGLFLTNSEKPFVKKIKEYYFGKRDRLDLLGQFKSMTQLTTDRWFGFGSYKAALGHSKFGPVHFYYYKKIGPSMFDILIMLDGKFSPYLEILFGMTKNWLYSVVLRNPPVNYGVCHGDDLVMLFEIKGVFSVDNGDPNYEFSKDFVKTWVEFASLPETNEIKFRGEKIPLVNPKGEFKVIEINDTPSIIKFPNEDHMRFWESIDK